MSAPQASPVTPSSPDSTVRAAAPGPTARMTVYFDGACPLCRRETALYRRLTSDDQVAWCDVSEATGDEVAPDLSRDDALARFHVRDLDGRLLCGARAFGELWRVTPGFGWLGKVVRSPMVAPLAEAAYRVFLRARPYLQRMIRTVPESRPSAADER